MWRSSEGEGEFEAHFRSAPAAYFLFGADGRIVDLNDAARNLLGRPVEPQTFLESLEKASSDAFHAHLKAVFNGEGVQRGELQLTTPAGPRDVLIFSDPSGETTCRTIVAEITERRRAEEEQIAARQAAEERLHLKDEFLARLSHEIRSALASIVGFADLLRVNGGDEEGREMAGIIRQGGRHLLDTLDAVMDLARYEHRAEQVRRVPVDVVHHVRRCISVLEGVARSKGLSLVLRVEDEPAVALLSPIFIDRILHNLIDNALKYTSKGTVEVSVEQRDARVWIYVADTGAGISEDFMPRLFTPFERDLRHAAASSEGVGLGLAITKSFVELQDGHIFACSTKGEGSTFTVYFPAVEGEVQ